MTLASLGFEAHDLNKLRSIFNGATYEAVLVDNRGLPWEAELMTSETVGDFIALSAKDDLCLDVFPKDVF